MNKVDLQMKQLSSQEMKAEIKRSWRFWDKERKIAIKKLEADTKDGFIESMDYILERDDGFSVALPKESLSEVYDLWKSEWKVLVCSTIPDI